MRYDSQIQGLPNNTGAMPAAATTTNASLSGKVMPQPGLVSDPRMFNPGIKPTGAPVSFNPKAQSTITGAFGVPMENSFDRAMGPTV